MQVARRLAIVITWLVLGIIALLLFTSGAEGGVLVGSIVISLAIVLTFAFNWVFADKRSNDE